MRTMSHLVRGDNLVNYRTRFIFMPSAALALFCGLFAPTRPAEASTIGGESDAASLRTLIQAREMYALVHRGGPHSSDPNLPRRRDELVNHLQRLADSNPSPSSIRRLALIQYALGDERWRSTIARLTSAGTNSSPFESERELSMWRCALNGERITPAVAMGLRKRIKGLQLGWYEH